MKLSRHSRIKDPKLVCITWLDHSGDRGHGAWRTLDEAAGGHVYEVETVGWLIGETKDAKNIASTMSADLCSGTSTILKSCITKIVYLSPKRRPQGK
jgi:hypothetical protein